MSQTWIGFDEALDRTAVETRRQAGARVAIGVMCFLVGMTAIPIPALLVWAAMYATGDLTLWVATDPANQARRPVLFRSLRLAATGLSTWAWMTIGLLWWFTPEAWGKAVGVGLIAGVLLYVVRGCHRSMAQMLVSGLPPVITLLALPFTVPSLNGRIGLLGSLALLVAYAASSGIEAWRVHRRLQKTTAALVQKQEEAEAASIAKSEFLANMSHEIRTPLNGVLAMAHLLAKADLPPREKEAAAVVCASGEVLERLLSDILDLAKVEAGQMTLEVAPFDVAAMVRSVAALTRLHADEKGVRLQVSIAPEAEGLWRGDAVRVRQVLGNLLSNAVKFTAQGEVIVQLAQESEDALRFSVTDSGVGFDPSLKARLFDRFEQADGSITRRFGGSGLGLAISRRLVEMMGGVLDCDSEPGRGARFWFDLPLSRAAEASAAPVAAPAAGPRPATDEPLRVLVADDHPTNVKVVEIILAQTGASVTTVTDGLQAVEAWAAEPFDVILMDMQMPVMDGLTAVARIRSAEASSTRPRTPILMLTANALAEHVRASRAAGADGHLTKPISPAGLLEGISAAMVEPAQRDTVAA